MSGRPGFDDAWAYERLLDGAPPSDAAQRGAAAWVDAVRAPATDAELAGLADAVATFQTAGPGEAVANPREARPGRHSRGVALRLPAGRTARVAVLTAAGAVLLAGTAAAATGSLPTPLQRAVHLVGAPEAPGDDLPAVSASARASASPSGALESSPPGERSSAGPVASGAALTDEALAGLCRALDTGGLSTSSAAYRALLAKAGSAQAVPSLCDDLKRHHPARSGQPSGNTHPSTGPDGHATPPTHTPKPTAQGNATPHARTAPPVGHEVVPVG